MSESFLSISFSPESLAEIAQFAGFRVLLDPEVQAALEKIADAIIAAARSNMHWKNPTGALEGSIRRMTDSPYEREIGSDDPKARRREFGFSGMTDSLGRFYANDPGAFYLTQALQSNEQPLLGNIDAAVSSALSRLGG